MIILHSVTMLTKMHFLQIKVKPFLPSLEDAVSNYDKKLFGMVM